MSYYNGRREKCGHCGGRGTVYRVDLGYRRACQVCGGTTFQPAEPPRSPSTIERLIEQSERPYP